MPIELVVNGVRHSVDAQPDRTLLIVLRDELNLTGTKYGCGEGQCGACTVMLEDRALRSCQTKLSAVEGKRITTIEGLEEHGRLHPLQEAFLEADAMQCAYCTPGMIISGAALLKRNPNPSETEIRHGIAGNLCRCTGYLTIVRAIRAAAERMNGTREAAYNATHRTVSNSPVPPWLSFGTASRRGWIPSHFEQSLNPALPGLSLGVFRHFGTAACVSRKRLA